MNEMRYFCLMENNSIGLKVERLPSKHEVLSSNASTTKTLVL
jgi:hypothetical protein